MTKPFVNLHSHSFYSILQGTMSPQVLLEKAKSLDHPGVALTDNGVGYGLIDFYKKATKLGGIKPILGVEVAIAKDSRFEKRPGIDGKEGTIVLLAQSIKGYQTLLNIISTAHLEGFFDQARIDWEFLSKNHDGLICLTGDHKGLIGTELDNNNPQKAQLYLDKLVTIFGKEHCFLEICAKLDERQKQVNEWKIKAAQSTGLECVATSAARFANAEDEESADTLHCIGQNYTLNDPHREKIMVGNYFRSWEDIVEVLHYIDDDFLEKARKNTLKIHGA